MIRWAVFLLLAGFVLWFFGFVEVAALADKSAELLILFAVLAFLYYSFVNRKPKDPMDERIVGS